MTFSTTSFPRFKLFSFFHLPHQREWKRARTFFLGYPCLRKSKQPEATRRKNHKTEKVLCRHDQEFDKNNRSFCRNRVVFEQSCLYTFLQVSQKLWYENPPLSAVDTWQILSYPDVKMRFKKEALITSLIIRFDRNIRSESSDSPSFGSTLSLGNPLLIAGI